MTNDEIARHYAKCNSVPTIMALDELEATILAALNTATAERDREIAALKSQLRERTQWVCQCGGTDCNGRLENDDLRCALELATDLLDDSQTAGAIKFRKQVKAILSRDKQDA